MGKRVALVPHFTPAEQAAFREARTRTSPLCAPRGQRPIAWANAHHERL
jgi:hypothetical protein